MLHYCSGGRRNYFLKPVENHLRHNWEFQIFTGGRSCISFPEKTETSVSGNFLIVRPDCSHGWRESLNCSCEVAVFHFSEVPETLGSLFYRRQALGVTLGPKELNTARELAEELSPEVLKPDSLSPVRFRLGLDRLSLMFLEKMNLQEEIGNPSREKMIVQAAVAWMRSHMDEGPDVYRIAEKMGYNVSHLRRLFIQVTGSSPVKEMTKQRMMRAAELLKTGNSSIIDISTACGYSSHSAFTRAFKKHYGVSPSDLVIRD